MKTDVQIAQEAKMKPIRKVTDYLGFPEKAIELYGNYKAKLNIHGIPPPWCPSAHWAGPGRAKKPPATTTCICPAACSSRAMTSSSSGWRA